MKKSSPPFLRALAALFAAAAAAAQAQVHVDAPWVRTTAPQQKTTGAYMAITSTAGGKLVDVSTPVASSVEVHEMKMDGDMMKMRQVDALPLPAGVPVKLAPGAYHMMLLGLKAPVKAGDVVPIRLVIEDAAGRRETVDVTAVAKAN